MLSTNGEIVFHVSCPCLGVFRIRVLLLLLLRTIAPLASRWCPFFVHMFYVHVFVFSIFSFSSFFVYYYFLFTL